MASRAHGVRLRCAALSDGTAIVLFLAALALAALILGTYYDHSWLPRDDGYYAHIAERLLAGDILHRDVQALHAGYVYFAGALALDVFGRDLVSLRYPLVDLGVIQAGLVYLLLLPRGPWVGLAGAVAVTALSFVQFPDPTAHWYCQFLFFTLVAALRGLRAESAWRPLAAGFLVVAMILFRQLTGVFVAMGVVTYLLAEAAEPRRGSCLLARTVVVIAAAGLAVYLALKSDPGGTLLMGLWPLAVLGWACFTPLASEARAARTLGLAALGGAVAAAPLVIYHAATGSFAAWYRDSVADALSITTLEYIRWPSYWRFMGDAVGQVLAPRSLAGVVNGVFWPSLTLLPALLGLLLLRRLWRSGRDGWFPHPLPFLAIFYAPVALHYQVSTYLFFVAGTTVAGILWLAAAGPPERRHTRAIAALALAVVALHYHAGQPLSRGYDGRLEGRRVALVPSRGLEGVSLWIAPRYLAGYTALMDLIEREVAPDETILAIPANPDLYFLSRRRNPLPYSFVPFGVRDERTLARALKTLAAHPPRLVFRVPRLPYNTAYTDRIMDFVRARYERLPAPLGFVVYRYRDRPLRPPFPPASGDARPPAPATGAAAAVLDKRRLTDLRTGDGGSDGT